MERLREQIGQVAATPLPVLLAGETGTGKEVAARALHVASGRAGPFVPVDCAALTASLIESELFGHAKGAFTGADQRRDGLVTAAERGTFFLDEVGELPLPAQTRLLRLLEAGTYRPVGHNEERRADIRVVAATWRDLRERVHAGAFREDLYHRLSVVVLTLPALRQRPEDLPELMQHFLKDACGTQREPPLLDPGARATLARWTWPGNVRELRNVARYLAAMVPGAVVRRRDLPEALLGSPPPVGHPGQLDEVRTDLSYKEARRHWLDQFQIRYVEALLDAHGGNVSAAARAADMDRSSIQRILKRARSPAEADDPSG